MEKQRPPPNLQILKIETNIIIILIKKEIILWTTTMLF